MRELLDKMRNKIARRGKPPYSGLNEKEKEELEEILKRHKKALELLAK